MAAKALQFNVLVLGAGGTGSYLLSALARFLDGYIANGDGKADVRLMIMDGDRVEDKNLDRQCFLPSDIGEFKSVVLAGAINECYSHLNAIAYPEYLKEASRIREVFSYTDNKYFNGTTTNILVGCVDNHRARQEMHKYFVKADDLFYIDSANEFSKGEVVVGIKGKGTMISPDRTFYFPDIMRSREKRAGESCGTINKKQPQHIITNMLAANVTLSKLIPIFNLEKSALKGGITYFDAFGGEMLTKGGRDVLEERAS